MKKILYVLLGLFIITSCEQNRIVYVNNSYVINEYQERKDIEAKYKSKVEAYTKKRDSIGQALQLEYQTFQLKSKNMSEKDAQAEYNVLMQKQQMLQQQFQLEEQQIAKESQTEIDSLYEMFFNIIGIPASNIIYKVFSVTKCIHTTYDSNGKLLNVPGIVLDFKNKRKNTLFTYIICAYKI